jgi:hypothetical protein
MPWIPVILLTEHFRSPLNRRSMDNYIRAFLPSSAIFFRTCYSRFIIRPTSTGR